MFLTAKSLEASLKKVLGITDDSAALKLEIRKLKEDLENLKLQKKMEETEIKHLVKLKEERQQVEFDKQKNSLEKEFNTKEMGLQTKYHEQVMGVIQKEHEKLQALYKEIIGRLPDVNMTLTKKL